MLPRKLVPSLNIDTTSMSLAPVLSTLELDGNFTAAEPSVPNVAVLEPVPSCVMMIVTVPPVGSEVILNSVFVPSVTVCTLAVAQSTVIVLDDVSALIRSLNPALKVTALLYCDVPSTSIPSSICMTEESLDFSLFTTTDPVPCGSSNISALDPGDLMVSASIAL